jgi:hypothetical protein
MFAVKKEPSVSPEFHPQIPPKSLFFKSLMPGEAKVFGSGR